MRPPPVPILALTAPAPGWSQETKSIKVIRANKVITKSQNSYDFYFSTISSEHLLLRMFKSSSFDTENTPLVVINRFHN